MKDGPDHISQTEARQGTTPHMARYALAWGTGLTIVAFAILLIIFL